LINFSRKKILYWSFQIFGWTSYALLNIFFVALIRLAENGTFASPSDQIVLSYFLQAAFFLVSTHIFRNLILKWRWIKMHVSQIIPRVSFSVLVLSILNYLFQVFTAFNLGTINFQTDFEPVVLLTNIFLVYIFYFLWASIYFLYNYMESYNASLKQEAAINEIRLNALKSQLNPHFIFNALNSVRALVDEDPRKAKIAITQLSNILRNSLVMDKKMVIPFNDEIKTVKDYLNLELIRFEERLQTKFIIHPESGQFEVPPLMVQTLVENGIKHGISNLVAGGLLQIETDVQNNMLTIKIKNSGQYINGVISRKGTGYGLQNTEQRLKLIFGDQATFRIFNESDKFVMTEVKIPQRI
jgi:two-component system, LytTR family, sensor kinase